MALIQCTYCGHTISDKAIKCPKCGQPIQQQKVTVPPKEEANVPLQQEKVVYVKEKSSGTSTLLIVLLLILVVVLSIGLWWMYNNKSTPEETSKQDSPTMVEEKDDGTSESTTKNDMDEQDSRPDAVDFNGYEAIDLGLSVLWSTHNVGASNERESGELYGWGNTDTYLTKTLNQYPCKNPPANISGTTYDNARNLWGGDWRMPTLSELEELKDRCTWSVVEYDNRLFSKAVGPNGNSILFPLDGYRFVDELKAVNKGGFIWSSELYNGNNQFAANLALSNKGEAELSGYYRYSGQSIRPVMDK